MNESEKFTISNAAEKRISFLLEKRNNPNTKLRVSVEGGGCAGFQYRYNFVDDFNENIDIAIFQGNAKIIIDKVSLSFLNGSTLDFQEDLNGAFFKINNPNAASGCGCGNSFSI